MIETVEKDQFLSDVCEGLSRRPKQLSPMYFYDAQGSALFDAICRIPWYTIPRAESGLLEKHAAEMLRFIGSNNVIELIELGPGDGSKIEFLVRELLRTQRHVRVGLVDISTSALESATKRLHIQQGVEICSFGSDYAEGLALATQKVCDGQRLVLFLGSNIGNFTPGEATAFLSEIRAHLRPGDALLCGIDLVKDESTLITAYQDPGGVTAAFNKNLLVRINRELGADFDPERFQHVAVWNADASRVEMHLVSQGAQTVRIGLADTLVRFEDGESIWTESSYKYTRETAARLFQSAGFSVSEWWVDETHQFADVMCRVP